MSELDIRTVVTPDDSVTAPGDTASRTDVGDDFGQALRDAEHPYHALASALLLAYEQAAFGKGKERHANDLPFTEQRMQTICRDLRSTHGMTYQVAKKAVECERMERPAKVRELCGAIVYAAGAIVFEQRTGGLSREQRTHARA
ncbi:hypothetical protein [Billgrantia desiderata]|uniref:hypothetical protein n=1 Tax=Billgrantia desiderata TaxID=52021 RepID=UPI001F4187CB|nr:hypothetical protein [Halomonas desiderata]MCE8012914.1 hypothetical protein [Halomonas desiderata]